jgi:hypothetical protein
MARVKMIPPDATDGEVRKVYDHVLKQWGRVSNFSQVLAHQPAALMGWALPIGKKIGLTDAQIAAARGDGYMASPDLDDRQKAAVRWAEAVTNMTARDDDAAFAGMKQHFTEKQIVELTVFCGMWNYSNRLCEALHVDLERPDKRIEFQK